MTSTHTTPDRAPTPSSRENGPPFDKPDADIIIRSSDQVDFRVHKLILKLASPVFETMFSLPQGSCLQHDKSIIIKDDLQVIQLEQDSQTLRQLLQICYPGLLLTRPELEEIGNLMKAAHFYQMTDLPSQLQCIVSTTSILKTDPLRAYILACRWGWKDTAKEAARASLGMELLPLKYYPEMDGIPATALVRLFSYHETCRSIAKSMSTVAAVFPQLKKHWPSFHVDIDLCTCNSSPKKKYHPPGHFSGWWADYLQHVGSRLAEKPCRETIMSSKISSHTADKVTCKKCMMKIWDIMFTFNEELWTVVDKQIGKVKLEFVSTV